MFSTYHFPLIIIAKAIYSYPTNQSMIYIESIRKGFNRLVCFARAYGSAENKDASQI